MATACLYGHTHTHTLTVVEVEVSQRQEDPGVGQVSAQPAVQSLHTREGTVHQGRVLHTHAVQDTHRLHQALPTHTNNMLQYQACMCVQCACVCVCVDLVLKILPPSVALSLSSSQPLHHKT